jgi:sigma-E factor negative regulatory protein RseB
MSGGRQRSLAGCLLALVLVSASVIVQADDEADEWLDRMLRAIETLNYRGTLVHMRDGHVDTLRIVHRADEDGIRERIVSIDGPPREVLRDGKQVRILLGGDQSMVVHGGIGSRLLPNVAPNRLSQTILAYRMSFSGTERVAGLYARVLEIRPRDQFRYGHRFWLEEDTGMLLRSALLDYEGNYLQHLSFVTIDLDVAIGSSELEPELDVSDALEIKMSPVSDDGTETSSELARPSWTPRMLPDGFRLASVSRGYNSDGQEFEHLLFSDGLASFSVYVKAAHPEDGPDSERIDAIGPVHVFTGTVEDHRVTVVGEVPSATVAFVAQQLHRRQAELTDR